MGDSLLREIERGVHEILEAMLQAILRYLEEMRKRNKELDQQLLVRVHHIVRSEIEKNISEQLRRQVPQLKISSVELTDHYGKSIKFHLVNDQAEGKDHKFLRLEDDKLVFNPSDGKGKPVYLDIKELEKVLPALEGRLAAMRTLSKLDNQQVVQSLIDSFKKEKSEGITLSKAYQTVMGEKVKHDIRQSRQIDLTASQKYNDYFQNRQNEIAFELSTIKLEKMDLETQLEAGLITKKEYKTKIKDLDKKSSKLKKEVKILEKGVKKFSKRLGKELERHCPDLSTKGLSFQDKITLAESAFKQPEGLDNKELRDLFEGQGDHQALQVLDKAEGRERSEEMMEEKSTISIQSTFDI